MERSTTIPLADFFCGGIAGTAVLGTIYDALGWPASVLGIGLALLAAACLTPGSSLLIHHFEASIARFKMTDKCSESTS